MLALLIVLMLLMLLCVVFGYVVCVCVWCCRCRRYRLVLRLCYVIDCIGVAVVGGNGHDVGVAVGVRCRYV